MKPFLFIFLGWGIAFYFMACKLSRKTQASSPVTTRCPQLVSFIESNWRIQPQKGFYSCDTHFLIQLKKRFDPCIPYLTKKDIIDLFGTPSEDLNDGSLNYYLDRNCREHIMGACHYLSFVYDTESNKVITFVRAQNYTNQ